MNLNDAQRSVIMAMWAGAELVVHRPTGGASLVVENKSAKAIPFDVWHPIYGLDLIERGAILEGPARLYGLTEFGRTAQLET